MRALALVLLTACAAEPPPVRNHGYVHAETPPVRYAPLPPPPEPSKPWEPPPVCTLYRAQIEDYKARIEVERAKEAAWRKDHCKPVLHRETAIDPVTGARASSAYDAAWMECDGKLVNVDGAESDAHIDLRNEMGALSSKMFRECQPH